MENYFLINLVILLITVFFDNITKVRDPKYFNQKELLYHIYFYFLFGLPYVLGVFIYTVCNFLIERKETGSKIF